MTATDRAATVSVKSLIRRIDRRLPKGQKLMTTQPGGMERSNLGKYYVLNRSRNIVVDSRVDIARLGRKLDALAPSEVVENAPAR